MNTRNIFNFQIKTYGCKVNSYDTGLLEKKLTDSGLVRREGEQENQSCPQVYVLNSCAVTSEATKEAVRQARRIKSKNSKAIVVVTGCAAQVDTDLFSKLPEVDLVVANSHKADLPKLLKEYLNGRSVERVHKSNIFKIGDLGAGGGKESEHTRSFLKIQDGCNSFCTFCVIPFARGKSRSLPVSDLVSKINSLYEDGVREVVLTGVHIGDYKVGPHGLEDLVEACLNETAMPRFRLSSLEPIELSERLLELFQHEKMCPHFHISLQSANSKVLKDMKRNYGHEEVEVALKKIEERVPGAFVGMDIIAGFPGESEEEFEDTLQRMENLPWTRMHVFPYSPRPGTFAQRMSGQWERSLIMKRAKRLRELSDERFNQAAALQVGSVKEALVLGHGRQGLSRDYWNIQLEGAQEWVGKFVKVRTRGYDPSRGMGQLIGEVI